MCSSCVSIIVPIYKVEEYLSECIDSLVNQTYKNIEIILVEDGSPDGCVHKYVMIMRKRINELRCYTKKMEGFQMHVIKG